jgi:hypothetical protein
MEVRGFTEVTSMGFWTSNGRSYGPFGDTWRFPNFVQEGRIHGGLRRRIVGFTGRSGTRLDFVRVIDNFGQCGHFACVEGPPMQSSCDPCVQRICANDSWCCSGWWDSQCVAQVASVCGATCNQN